MSPSPPPPGWQLANDSALVRDLRFKDFGDAWRYLERLSATAVDYEQRPDMSISLNRVRLRIANPHHAGITAAELRLAAKVDRVAPAG